MFRFLVSIPCALALLLALLAVVAVSGCKKSGPAVTSNGWSLAVLTRPPTLADAPMIYDQAGCGTAKCHGSMTAGGGTAPSLAHEGSKHDFIWIAAYMRDPKATNPKSAMPSFGDETKVAYGNIQALAGALEKQK